ncbi:MAG: helix-turn-helix domain-containing protein [Pseudomonadota bacterium]
MTRAGLRSAQMRYAYLMNICVISLLLITGTPPWTLRGSDWLLLNVFSTLIFPLAWLFGLSLFEEDFTLGKSEIAVLAIYAVPPSFFAASLLGFEPFVIEPFRLAWLTMSFGLMAHIAYVALAGRSEDLVEARRRDRARIAIGIAVMLVFIFAGNEVFRRFGASGAWRFFLLIAPPYCIGMLLWMTRAHPEALAFDTMAVPGPAATTLDPRDLPAKNRLDALMNEDKIYREQGLTIRRLAEKVSVPEHQLRVVINKSLGFRSFAYFLNHHRIQEAEARLSDISNARIPVLTIAMDVGYASITPFNKAFKSQTGKTPTSYRKAALAGISPDSGKPA